MVGPIKDPIYKKRCFKSNYIYRTLIDVKPMPNRFEAENVGNCLLFSSSGRFFYKFDYYNQLVHENSHMRTSKLKKKSNLTRRRECKPAYVYVCLFREGAYFI